MQRWSYRYLRTVCRRQCSDVTTEISKVVCAQRAVQERDRARAEMVDRTKQLGNSPPSPCSSSQSACFAACPKWMRSKRRLPNSSQLVVRFLYCRRASCPATLAAVPNSVAGCESSICILSGSQLSSVVLSLSVCAYSPRMCDVSDMVAWCHWELLFACQSGELRGQLQPLQNERDGLAQQVTPAIPFVIQFSLDIRYLRL